MGFTASRICACGPGVAPMRIVCVCAAAGRAVRESRATRPSFFRDMRVLLVRGPDREKGSAVADALVEASGETIADTLDGLHEHDEHHDDGEHHFGHEALIAVADAQIAETAAADR